MLSFDFPVNEEILPGKKQRKIELMQNEIKARRLKVLYNYSVNYKRFFIFTAGWLRP